MQQLSKDWLSKQEAADYLGVSPQTVMTYVRLGKLTAARVSPRGSSRVRISATSIERLMESSRHQTAPASPRR